MAATVRSIELDKSSWANYIEDTKNETSVLPALEEALELQDIECGNALDIGCGSGKDTLALLKSNKKWHVMATDIAPEAIKELAKRVEMLTQEPEHSDAMQRLKLESGDFLAIDFQDKKFNIINSAAVLPYVGGGDREQFKLAWNKTVNLLASRGSLTLQMFGSKHSWNTQEVESKHPLVFFTREELKELFPKEIFQSVAIEERNRDLSMYGIANYHDYIIHAIKV